MLIQTCFNQQAKIAIYIEELQRLNKAFAWSRY